MPVVSAEEMTEGLRELETQDGDALRMAETALPVFIELSDLRKIAEAQTNAYETLGRIFDDAKAESDAINKDWRGELVVAKRKEIKEKAFAKVDDLYPKMVERAKMAALTTEFHLALPVRQRAAFADPVKTAALVTRVAAASPISLLGFARLAVATRDLALSTVVLEATQAREANIPDAIRHGIVSVIGAMPIPEAEEGKRLCIEIRAIEQSAQRAIRAYQTGRVDIMSKIEDGLRARND